MPISLYEAFVPGCQQTLAGLDNLIGKGEAHAREHGLDDSALIEARLAEDMWALPHHVRACWMHSAYSFDQMKTGEFTPDFTTLPESWDAMHVMVAEAQDKLAALTHDEVEALSDKTIGFVMGGKTLMKFTGANFMLSFNQPNVYFHAATFYDILRAQGVQLTKMDFMGPVRAGV